jgi:hypothetical protein
MVRLCYIDGLVSTGNQIPYTILKIIFPNEKIFHWFFINIFFHAVDKGSLTHEVFLNLNLFFIVLVVKYFSVHFFKRLETIVKSIVS